MRTDPIIGIDLGTTNSVVATCSDDGSPILAKDDDGYKIQPSVVSFHPNGSVAVGAAAKQRRVIDPENTVYSSKRLIGRTFQSPEVSEARQRMPYKITEGANQQPVIQTRAGEFAIPEISAIVLDHMRKIAQATAAEEVTRTVVTVPASFTDAQRSATATAGAIAGLTVVRVLNEPTAAALAYGHLKTLNKVIAVYDFGGGTFDVTLLQLQDTVYRVLATAGDSFLGGDDIDEHLVDRMVQAFLAKERIDLRTNEAAMQRLRVVAEQAKIQLSRRTKALIKIDEIAYGPGGKPVHLEFQISRDEFVSHVAGTVDRTFPVCKEAVKLAGLKPEQVNDVILVGGTTKMPYVRQRVSQFFRNKARTDINPDEAVAVGAALQADSLRRVLGGDAARPTARQAAPPPTPPTPARQPTSTETRTEVDPTPRGTVPSPFGDAEAEIPTRVVPRPSTERPAQPGAHSDRFQPKPAGQALARIKTNPGLGDTATNVLAAQAPTPNREQPKPRKTIMAAAAPPPIPAIPPATADVDTITLDDTHTNVSRESEPVLELSDVMALTSDETAELTDVADEHASPEAPLPASAFLPSRGPATGPDSSTMIADAGLGALGNDRADSQFNVETLTQATQEGPTVPRAPVQTPTIIEVTPHSLGIGTVAGFCEELIERNSRVPAQTQKRFSTSKDSQQTVRIRVCQGESRRLNDNVILGDLLLEGLEPRPRGDTKIEVTFEIDGSGMLHVSARDQQTGQEQRATLSIAGAQSPEELEAAKDRFREIRG